MDMHSDEWERYSRGALDMIVHKVSKIDVLIEATRKLEEQHSRLESSITKMADAVTKLAVIEERQDQDRKEMADLRSMLAEMSRKHDAGMERVMTAIGRVEERVDVLEKAELMKRAEDAEGRAARSLAEARASVNRRIQEAKREAYELAGSGCGVSGALRLRLNAAIGDVPAGAGHAAGADASAAADSGEREVAQWVLDAAQRYEECRARIEAIRQWDAGTHGEGP